MKGLYVPCTFPSRWSKLPNVNPHASWSQKTLKEPNDFSGITTETKKSHQKSGKVISMKQKLGGGFKYFLFSPVDGEDFHVD